MSLPIKIHKYFAYTMVFAVQITVCTGIARRISISPSQNDGEKIALIIVNLLIFIVGLASGEILHQRRLKARVEWKRF